MRQIKFRAWDSKYKVIVPWEDISESRTLSFLVNNHNKGVSNCILQQFTGLTDKNGVAIYEGDIVKYIDNVFSIKYRERYCDYILCYIQSGNKGRKLYQDICDRIGVIGNIYENPELRE
jgi:uncharacterized phage protein (TIGR01671 family)